MSMDVLLQGVLASDPQSRTSSKGNAYATALLRVPLSDSDAELFSIIAFNSTAVDALLQRSKGDSIAVSGSAQRNDYTDKNGTERKGWKVVAEALLSLYHARKARKAAGGDKDADEQSARRSGPPGKPAAYDRSKPIEQMPDDLEKVY
jgi:single-strand DNA-binding protein